MTGLNNNYCSIYYLAPFDTKFSSLYKHNYKNKNKCILYCHVNFWNITKLKLKYRYKQRSCIHL